MAITLRSSKSLPLTFAELDGNFSDLDTRLDAVEDSYVSSINSLTGAVTLTTDDISEGSSNLYYTASRVNSAFDTRLATKTTTNLTEGSNLYYTDARADARIALQVGANLDLSSKTTDNLTEGSNLYYTDARADARIAAAELTDLSNIDATSPTLNYVLTWDGNNWIPAAAPGASGGEANTGSNLDSGFEIFKQKVGVDFQFRSLTASSPLSLTQNANTVAISFSLSTDLDVDSNKIINLTDPTDAQDAATKNYIDNLNANIAYNVTADAGSSSSISNGDTLTLVGTANQIVTTGDGAGDVTFSLAPNINVNASSADSLSTARTIQLSGDVTGTASFDGTANVNIVTSRAANSVALGTDTTGIYVADLTAGTGVTIADGTVESANITVSIGQAVETSSDVTFNDLTLSGNLTVNGTTTTVDTTNMSVADLLVYLGDGRTGTPSGDAGLIIERGDLNNAFIGYDESADQFIMGTGTFTGTSTGDLIVSKGTLAVGKTVVDNVNVDGNTISTSVGNLILSPTGDISANSNKITNVSDPTSAQDVATKAYVDSETSSISTILGIAGDTGTDDVTVGTDTLTFAGGTNIATTITDNQVSIAVSGTVANATDSVNSTKILTQSTSTNASFYPTFVDSNNGVAANETVYTDAGISYNPSTNILTVTGSVDATATSAQYADLAEKYTADEDYEPGTLLQVSITQGYELEEYDGTTGVVAGVVSTNPAYLMNASIEGIEVALVGRVPVKVAGTIAKGFPVYALAGHASPIAGGPMVGIALESKTTEGIGLVECLLKI